MRLCLPARMGGGGKAESTPWRGPAGAQRPPHGGGYSALGTRGQSPWCSRLSNELRRSASLSRNAAQSTAPLHSATPTGDVTASRAKTRLLRHRRSAASRSERAVGARTARREARAPSGQHENAAPCPRARAAECDHRNSRSFATARPGRHTLMRHAIVTARPRR